MFSDNEFAFPRGNVHHNLVNVHIIYQAFGCVGITAERILHDKAYETLCLLVQIPPHISPRIQQKPKYSLLPNLLMGFILNMFCTIVILPQEDDEQTLEEDEALITEEERQEELTALQSEIDLPLEELLKRYGVEKREPLLCSSQLGLCHIVTQFQIVYVCSISPRLISNVTFSQQSKHRRRNSRCSCSNSWRGRQM